MSIAIIAEANSVAEPRSPDTGFGCRCRLGGHGEPRQRRGGADPGHHQTAVATDMHHRTGRSDPASGRRRRFALTTGGQAGRFARRVDAADLHAHGTEAADTQHQDRHQGGDRKGRLDGDRTPVIQPVI